MSFNLFISHSWSHDENYVSLTNLLDKKIRFEYKDYSIPKSDPLHINAKKSTAYKIELRNKIKNQMKYASVVIILAGVYASYSDSIEMEIEIAKELGKKIIAVEYWGSERTSVRVKNAADKIVGWNTDSIVDAIRTLSI